MKFLSMILLTVTAGALCFGAEGEPNSNGNRRGGFGGQRGGFGGQRGGQRGGFGGQRGGFGGQRGGGMMQSKFFVELEIAKKFPAEYAEVEKMREAYEASLSALAAKAGVTLPTERDAAYRKLRKADPAAFDAVVEKMKTSPREGFQELMALASKHGIELMGNRSGMNRAGTPETPGVPGNRDAGRGAPRPDMAELRRKYPEQMKEYDELRRKDYNKARQLLLKIIELDKSGKK